jgi:hypothetical protein
MPQTCNFVEENLKSHYPERRRRVDLGRFGSGDSILVPRLLQ